MTPAGTVSGARTVALFPNEGKAVPSDHAPCCDGYLPVIIVARVGVHVGFTQYAREKMVPSLPSLSNAGVLISLLR